MGQTLNYLWDYAVERSTSWWTNWKNLWDSVDAEMYKRSKNLFMQGHTIYGNETSGGNLILSSTSNATKGKILFGLTGNCYFDEATETLNIAQVSQDFDQILLYNIRGTNYERAYLNWDSNIFKIGTEKGGTGTVRNLELMGSVTIDPNGLVIMSALAVGEADPSSLIVSGSGDPNFVGTYDIAGTYSGKNYYECSGVGFIWWLTTSPGYWIISAILGTQTNDFYSSGSALIPPLGIYEGQIGASGTLIVALPSTVAIDSVGNVLVGGNIGVTGNLATAQLTVPVINIISPGYQYFYNVSGVDYERAYLKWDSNIFKIGTEKGGSGTLRELQILIGANRILTTYYGGDSIGLGLNSLGATEGGSNIAIGNEAMGNGVYGDDNIAIGRRALRNMSDSPGGQDNHAIGPLSYQDLTVGDRNIGIGCNAFMGMLRGSENLALGNFIGYWYTDGAENAVSRMFFIDNIIGRNTFALQKANALVYGVMSNTYDGQTFRINAETDIWKLLFYNVRGTITHDITEFEDYGSGRVKVYSSSHSLPTGSNITITATTNYNGTYTITDIDGNSFYIYHSWDGDDGTGEFLTESNYERSYFRWYKSKFYIGTEYSGTGTQRGIRLEGNGIGINTDPYNYKQLLIGGTRDGSPGEYEVLDIQTRITGDLDGGHIIGVRSSPIADGTNILNVYGVATWPTVDEEVAIGGFLVGFYSRPWLQTDATAQDMYGVFIDPYVQGLPTNLYGLKISDISAGDELNYSIYTGTGLVRFGGDVVFTSGMGGADIRMYNLGEEPGIDDYERSYMKWNSNIFKIGTEKSGSGVERYLQINAPRIYLGPDVYFDRGSSTFVGLATEVSYYNRSFTNADLVGGILTVNHNTGINWPFVVVYNEVGNQVIPDDYVSISNTTLDIDFTSFLPLTGTWHLGVAGPADQGVDGDFDDGDLVGGGVLTVIHNLGIKWPSVVVYDNNEYNVIPDEVMGDSTSDVVIDLSTHAPISGTWHYRVSGVGKQAFIQTFVDSDLVGNILVVNHGLGVNWPLVIIYDNNNVQVIPDQLTFVDGETCNINLITSTPLSGSWHVRVTGTGEGQGFVQGFVDGDVVGGILTINHGLNVEWPLVIVYNNNGFEVLPDELTYVDADTVSVDLTGFVPLAETWHIRVVGA